MTDGVETIRSRLAAALLACVAAATSAATPAVATPATAGAFALMGTDSLDARGMNAALALDDTVAVLDNVVATLGAVTTTVTGGAEVPLANVATVQLTDTLPALVHVHPAPTADTNVTPAGSVSVTKTAVASDGPALATARK